MEIDRKLAHYLIEIKRSLPEEQKRTFNISSPDIKEKVVELHLSTSDKRTKALTATFLENCGILDNDNHRQSDDLQLKSPSNQDIGLNSSSKTRSVDKLQEKENPEIKTNRSLDRQLDENQIPIGDLNSELLNAGILPEFLEHLDLGELPPLAGSSSSARRLPLNNTKRTASKRQTTKALKSSSALINKITFILTTPIEVSMPFRFTKRRQ